MSYKVVKIKYYPAKDSDVNILIGLVLQETEEKNIYFASKQRGYEEQFKKLRNELLYAKDIESFSKEYDFGTEGVVLSYIGITNKSLYKISNIFNAKFIKVEVVHPAVMLQKLMDEYRYTPRQLAELTFRNENFINRILRGEQDFAPRFTAELEKIFLIDQNIWLDQQRRYKEFYGKKKN